MTAQPKQPVPICSPETVGSMRWTAKKFAGRISSDQVISLCDSHEELRRQLDQLKLTWNNPAHEARTLAVQAEWPYLAELLDQVTGVT